VADYDTIPTHLTEVIAATRISESFVRITFAGGLDRFRPIGPDAFVYVLLPPPGRVDLPIETSFRWTDYYAMAEPDRPVGAYYTVRSFRADAGELDCDIYLHEPAGHGSRWAPHAKSGDLAALWGPRSAWHPPVGTTDWLLVADETGLPAVAAVLEHRPIDTPVRVIAEVASACAHVPLPSDGPVDIEWLHRDGRDAGTTSLLVDAVRAAAPPPSSTTYAWGGAESRAMTAVRRYLRHEAGLTKEQVSMTPYWRHASHTEHPINADD